MRACGNCVACCAYLKINALNKPACTNCRHLTLDRPQEKNEMLLTGSSNQGNCSIYEKRPQVCRDYECLWVMGHGMEQDRPDKSFILADTMLRVENGITCRQLKPGIADTEEGMATIVRMSRSTGRCVIVPSFYEQKIERIVGRTV